MGIPEVYLTTIFGFASGLISGIILMYFYHKQQGRSKEVEKLR